ncbi:MAG: glycosyltransferase, partial [Treponema berlinense]|nr:glycosyltransferase [Treponema berlinense]
FIVEKIMNPQTVPGWTTIIVLLLFFGGLQSTFLGIIGEYIGKNYLDQNNTPQWVVKETFGV